MVKEKFNNQIFKNFALKLKKEKLWNRFKIIDYYFESYNIDECDDNKNSFYKLYKALKNPEDFDMVCKKVEHKYKIFEEYGDEIPLNKVFERFNV